jgi:hemolysin activation/secretion protein
MISVAECGHEQIRPARRDRKIHLCEDRRASFRRRLSGEELYRARDAVTRLYHDQGFITSGAVLPDQEVEDGTVVLRVVEGRLADIEIEGIRAYHPSYFRNRLSWAGRTPVNIWRLEKALQLLQQDTRIDRVSASLVPGEGPGESRLELVVDEAFRADLELAASNYRSPSIGEFTGEIDGGFANVYGIGDRLSGRFEVAEGLYDYDLSYAVPVNRFDTLLTLRFRESRGKVVLDEFNSLDIESETRTWRIAIEQPLLRDFGHELRLGVIGELRESSTEIEDRSFCTVIGELGSAPGATGDAPDCHPRVAALRTFQQFVASRQRNAFALRSTITFGLDALSATRNRSSVADGRFVSWLGQLQYVHRLPPVLLDSELVGRVDGQLTSDPLLSMEKFALGGVHTVRGYRENQLVRDNGVVASVELRIPVLRGASNPFNAALVPFADFGHGWDESGPARLDTDTIASLGIGMRFSLFGAVTGELFYGGHLTGRPGENGDGLQQHGVHFRLTVDTLWPWR